jgi:hypothetical protein
MAKGAIEVPERWAKLAQNAPEAGMGYFIATVRVDTGEVFTHVVFDSGFITEVPGYAGIPFRGEQIADIIVTNDKSRYLRRRTP